METMAKKQPRPRRSFTPEFKAEVVELVRQPGNTAGSVARDLNLSETAVRAWARQADLDQGRRSDGLTGEQLSEMAQLRKELREAREERDILKRAVAFFAYMSTMVWPCGLAHFFAAQVSSVAFPGSAAHEAPGPPGVI